MKTIRPFHLAIPVSDLKKSKYFYHDIIGCKIGRSSDSWVDFDFFNHQLVIHLNKIQINSYHNIVDKINIPVPHFGIILNMSEWVDFAKRIKSRVDFIINPHIRFKGEKGEQATMFFKDPDQNYLEFKAFKSDDYIFKH